MKTSLTFLLILSVVLCSCATKALTSHTEDPSTQWLTITTDSLHKDSIQVSTLNLFDHTRNRAIPIAMYLPDSINDKQQLVVFSHGYGENQPGSNKAYAYLNAYLASQGYMVASIQHELPDDDLLPMDGNLSETRRPNWERGALNILFVINELKQRMPNLYFDKRVILIGHSNGGDISMLFASEYPLKVSKVISLDNRRMALPRITKPKVYSLRSSDQPADKGVLPPPEEQSLYGMTLIYLPNTKHGEMSDDTATELQKKEINQYILNFIRY